MYKNILLPIDLGEESSWRKALPEAVDLARHYPADLHIVAVVPQIGSALVGSFFPKDYEKRAVAEASKLLEAFIAEHVPSGIVAKGHIAHGVIYEEILHAANKIDVDLIVLGSHRPELKDYLLGPNAARVVRHARQSVMVVRE
ncbi:universal stress protein [Breoghania sp. L-A4]|uniref:universal stress protein n=1 Tax=Breoghania sp. L-A4 TaxID=2304600 RepID=UPI000E35E949|nr:universal stress protein [Breoghania sp. L-A4]AXS42563.1 universal stress protein [Breoghania sp. L-A4]